MKQTNAHAHIDADNQPLEDRFQRILDYYDIPYTIPERDRLDAATLDFYLPDFRLYVEVKQHSTPRMHDQVDRARQFHAGRGVMVLVGEEAVDGFGKLLNYLAR